jgi:hypothetical protein
MRIHISRTPVLLATAAILFTISPVLGQEAPANETTMTGTVASSTRNTLVVRSAGGQHQLFVFDRDTTKPASLPAGAQVRVISTQGEELGVRIARDVSILQSGTASRVDTAAPGTSASTEATPVIPLEVRRIEREIERQARRLQLGVRGGVGLDPELVMIGVQGQIGPFFHPDVYVRPNVEFGYGEVTALFGLNLEGIYRLPLNSRQGRWSAYAGAGPAVNLLHQNFERETDEDRIDFGDFKSDIGLNILGGVRFRSGTFVELKTTVYSQPAPTLRLIFGYNF